MRPEIIFETPYWATIVVIVSNLIDHYCKSTMDHVVKNSVSCRSGLIIKNRLGLFGLSFPAVETEQEEQKEHQKQEGEKEDKLLLIAATFRKQFKTRFRTIGAKFMTVEHYFQDSKRGLRMCEVCNLKFVKQTCLVTVDKQ